MLFRLLWPLLLILSVFSTGCAEVPESTAALAAPPAEALQIEKEDCASVYGEILSMTADTLTVKTGETVLLLTSENQSLRRWHSGDLVILYYTGSFGDSMQVHFIDRRKEDNSSASE